MEEYVICQMCQKKLKQISGTHLKKCSNITVKEYKKLFPGYKLRSPDVTLKIQTSNKIHKSGDNNPMKNPVHLEKMKINQKKVVSTPEHRKILSDSHLNPDSYFQKWMKTPEYHQLLVDAQKNMSEETKKERSRKLRIWKLQFLENIYNITGKKFFVNFNISACKIIEEFGDSYGYKFQHGLNIGEFRINSLGYTVDGYDKENNIVIEYYEPEHYIPKRIKYDEQRQKEIMECLKCTFIIIDGRAGSHKIFKYNEK